MRRYFAFCVIVVCLISSCGGDDSERIVTVTDVYEFIFSDFNLSNSIYRKSETTYMFRQDLFAPYVGQFIPRSAAGSPIPDFQVDKISLQITDVSSTQPSIPWLGLEWGTTHVSTIPSQPSNPCVANLLDENSSALSPIIDILSDGNGNLKNTDRVIIMDRLSPSNGIVNENSMAGYERFHTDDWTCFSIELGDLPDFSFNLTLTLELSFVVSAN